MVKSRNLGMDPDHDEYRLQFTISIAVNGVRDSSLKTCLMMEGNMKWDSLTSKLRARRSARSLKPSLCDLEIRLV